MNVMWRGLAEVYIAVQQKQQQMVIQRIIEESAC